MGQYHKKGHKTLVFFYYAGHGAMTSVTYAIVNHAEAKHKAKYPLELQLRTLGSIQDTFVLGVFDCCRVELPEHLRGTGDDKGEELDLMLADYKNCILTFGCAPRKGVPGASTIAVEYFETLR